MNKRILLTGAGGFLGQRLQERLLSQGRRVRALHRVAPSRPVLPIHEGLEVLAAGAIEHIEDFPAVLDGVEAVVHLAGRAHVLRERAADPEAAFMAANAQATAKLARASAIAGVRRFVFMSSIAVNGNLTPSAPFRESDPPRPHNLYGRSKLAAEEALAEENARSGLPVSVLRPPLVYGPSLKGNFPRLLRLAASGLPLPLAGLANLRSFIYVDNLADIVNACLDAPLAGHEVYLVSDNQDVSTPALIAKLRALMGKRIGLFSVHEPLLRLAASTLGVRKTYDSLCGTLRIDPSKAIRDLSWTPRFSLDQGLAATVDLFLSSSHDKKTGSP
jgi:nucleoside-diphosphate-sugar epimerase